MAPTGVEEEPMPVGAATWNVQGLESRPADRMLWVEEINLSGSWSIIALQELRPTGDAALEEGLKYINSREKRRSTVGVPSGTRISASRLSYDSRMGTKENRRWTKRKDCLARYEHTDKKSCEQEKRRPSCAFCEHPFPIH